MRKPQAQNTGNTSEVFVAAGQGAYANVRHALSQVRLPDLRGRRVLVKPNAGRLAGPESGVVTHPQAVAAVLDLLGGHGCQLTVGESPIVGVKALEALEASGISAVARERGVPVVDLDAVPPVAVPVPDGLVLRELKVCAPVLEHDFVVSVAVMKTHMHTGASLGLKNMKGCLWGRTKVKLHQLPPCPARPEHKPLNLAIADMADILTPDLTVIDGFVGMEGLGPSAGTPKKLDAAVASLDTLAADSVACALMGLELRDVPYLELAAARGMGSVCLDGMRILPADWRSIASPFARPPADLSIQFPGVKVLDRESCSACQSTLLLFLKRYGREVVDYFPAGSEFCMAIGKGHESVPANTLCVGNCTAKHRARGVFVPGCPPVASAILEAINENYKTDGNHD